MRRVVLFLLLLMIAFPLEIKRLDISLTFSQPSFVREEYLVYLNDSENFNLSFAQNYGIEPSITGNISGLTYTLVNDTYSKNYRRVILEYQVDLIHVMFQSGRFVKKGFNSSIFVFSHDGFLSIPYYVTITLRVPPKYLGKITLEGNPESSHIDSDGYKNFVWRGPLNTKDFTIYYEEEIPISGSFSEFLKYITQPIYIIAFVVICVLAFIYRRHLKNVLYEIFS